MAAEDSGGELRVEGEGRTRCRGLLPQAREDGLKRGEKWLEVSGQSGESAPGCENPKPATRDHKKRNTKDEE